MAILVFPHIFVNIDWNLLKISGTTSIVVPTMNITLKKIFSKHKSQKGQKCNILVSVLAIGSTVVILINPSITWRPDKFLEEA
jgi:hypothetical protein